MRTYLHLLAAILVAVFAVGCGEVNYEPIVVNSLEDLAEPPEEVITLRSALASAASGQPIIFDESLDGGVIELSIVGNPHTMLKGEVMGMREEPSGPVSYLVGYFERDYGRSALYARKTVVIDASSLPSGITVAWTGGEANPARVLAVRGNLILVNVSITGGWSIAEEHGIGLWFDRVPSHMNPADSLSRDDLTIAQQLRAIRADPCMMPAERWGWGVH